MRKDSFSYDVNAEVVLTAAEVVNMMKCSAEHYDYACKAAGELGGFLYGLNNRFVEYVEPGATPAPAKLSVCEVDLLCKVLEGSSADKTLYWNMRRLLLSMIRESERVNEVHHA